MFDYLYLIAGLAVLIKAAGYLVSGASSIARGLNVSQFVVGLTVVSFGTSLPELVISLFASQAGSPDIIIGNVIGSNIANILLVLGVASIIYPLSATGTTVWREVPATFFASVVLLALLNDSFITGRETSALDRIDAVILLVFFGGFIYYVAQIVKKDKNRDWVGVQEEHNRTRSTIEIVVGIAGLVLGGRFTVVGAVNIAESWGMSEAFIGLTVIAIGTSLPELATSSVAAYRRNVDIAVGNVVGSNIFNIFIVLGISGIVRPIPFNTANNIDLMVMIAATILLFLFMLWGRQRRAIERWEGVTFVALYATYMGYLIMRG